MVKPWPVVLKILEDPGATMEPHYLWYWKREYLAHASELLADLPGYIAQPRCYAASDRSGSVWLWMEIVADTNGGAWEPIETWTSFFPRDSAWVTKFWQDQRRFLMLLW